MLEDLVSTFRTEAEATRSSIAEHETNRRKQNQWALTIIAVMAVLLGMVLVILFQNQQKSAQGREILRNNTAVSERIADCTTAGGTCYEDGQKRAVEYFSGQLKGQIAVAVCAKIHDQAAAIQSCVTDVLAELAKKPRAGLGTKPAPSASAPPTESVASPAPSTPSPAPSGP